MYARELKWIGLSAAVALTASALAGCARAQSAPATGRGPAAKAIKTEPVRQEAVRRTLEVVGTLAAEDEVTISSQAEGVVSRVLADLGDHVRAGQVLVELDREKLQYNLDQQRASLTRALTKYGGTAPDSLPPSEETPDVRKAAAELLQAKQAAERAGELYKRQLVPLQALDDAQTMLHSKQASYDSSLQNAKNMRADIDLSDATMKLADRQLRDAFIRAPFDGYVQQRMVSVGELVKTQMPVMSVVRVDPLKVMGDVPERMAPWIKVGQPVGLRVDAFPDKIFTATVSRISPAVNTLTRTFAFQAAAPNGDGVLKPGTFARVRIDTALVEQVLTVPYIAMQYRYGVDRAFVLNGDHIAARELKLGDRLGDRMEIVGGVKAGEQIALTDVDNLTDGMTVTVNGRTE